MYGDINTRMVIFIKYQMTCVVIGISKLYLSAFVVKNLHFSFFSFFSIFILFHKKLLVIVYVKKCVANTRNVWSYELAQTFL